MLCSLTQAHWLPAAEVVDAMRLSGDDAINVCVRLCIHQCVYVCVYCAKTSIAGIYEIFRAKMEKQVCD